MPLPLDAPTPVLDGTRRHCRTRSQPLGVDSGNDARVKPRLVAAPLALALVLAGGAGADTIVLVDGRVLDAERAWYEGSEVRCRRDGAVYSLPRALVERVEASSGEREPLFPDVERSRESLAAGDVEAALRHARLAAFHQPDSAAALEALAAAQLALADLTRARRSAEVAIRLAPERATAQEILGDVLAALGDADAARERYRLALNGTEEERIRRKLGALGPPSALVSTARFRMRYRGDADEPLGLAILQVLDRTWEEYEGVLGFSPDLPVTVVLQTDAAFRDTTRAPGWAAAWNDGTIRLPVRGLGRPTPGVVRVLRHELAHSFLASRVGPTCPTWLHEGIAQSLEGGDPAREDASLAALARGGGLLQLRGLEAPFSNLSEAEATSAYAQSLSAVAHLLRAGGKIGLRRLLSALASGQPTAEALVAAYGIDYPRLQSRWEAQLRGSDAAARSHAAGR